MIFYNGFNLLVDLVLISLAGFWFHGVGYRSAKAFYLAKIEKMRPPF